MTGELEGKVAIVTGAGSGIGRACAIRFAREGACVTVADRDEAGCRETAARVAAEGGRAHALTIDVGDEQDCDRLVRETAGVFGGVDLLLAAAGILHAQYSSTAPETGTRRHQQGQILNTALEDWERVLRVNLTGTMLTNRAAGREMVARGRGGAIVNIASAAAAMPLAGSADYCVSKAGVWMLTRVLALELAPYGIRVNAIGPGAIATPMIAATLADEERKRRAERDTPLGRIGEPEDIANTALYLLSDQSSYITGEIIFPTGGRFIR